MNEDDYVDSPSDGWRMPPDEYVVAMYLEGGCYLWACSCGAHSKTPRSVHWSTSEQNNRIGAQVHLSKHVRVSA
jgi:hypothetical protein